MAGFLLALVAVALASFGGRDQIMLARLADRVGSAGPLLTLAWTTVILSTVIMAVAASAVSGFLSVDAKLMVVAIAMLFAAVEVVLPNRDKAPKEPTTSLFAIGAVLFARQLTDAPRFLVFAFGIYSGMPMLAALGGIMAGGAGLTAGWLLGEELASASWLKLVRWILAALLGVTAIWIGLSARGIIG